MATAVTVCGAKPASGAGGNAALGNIDVIINCIHRGISRLAAEQLLLAAKQDGSFLIRDSETFPGAYTLCLLFEKHVHQYRILPDADGKLSVQSEAGVRSRRFVDLTQLIHEYMQRGLKNGLAGPLIHPVVTDTDDDNESDEERLEEENLQFDIAPPPDDDRPIERPISEYSVSGSEPEKSEFDEFIYRYFLQRFKHLNLSSCDGPFIENLKRYVEKGTAVDAHVAASGEKTMHRLRSVLDESAREIDRCIDNLMLKIDICRQLFGPMATTPLTKSEKTTGGEESCADVSSVIEKITRCKGAIQNLERKAQVKYKDLNTMWKEGGVTMPDVTGTTPRGLTSKPIIPATSFEAKVLKLSQLSRIKLTVDIQAGKLLAVKPNKDVLNDKNVFTHDKIEQLIKSTENKCRLDVVIFRVKRTYMFEDTKQRENFCQLVQQLKNMHSVDPDLHQISIFVGTWNMASEIPMYSLLQWLVSDGLGKKRNVSLAAIPHDIYAIGTQESVLSDKEWANKIKLILSENFGIEFHIVANVSLWSIRIVILVKAEHKNKISLVQQSCVRTGVANALGNKGAVGVSFTFSRTSLCFVCSHLTSGSERLKRRNQNFRDIIKGLGLGPRTSGEPFDPTNQFHHMFFFGDLNYRLDELDSKEIAQKIQQSSNYSYLLEYDQLKRTQKAKEALVGFREEEITFPPTYRFLKGKRDVYVWEKFKTTGVRINAPSWCDRILWRSYPGLHIINTSYGSVDRICSSDHKPVFASFDLRVSTQFTAAKGGSAPSGDIKILFQEITAQVKSSKQENFLIGFYSTCLEVAVESKPNNAFGTKKDGYCCPKWTSSCLPQPICDDWEYLEDQHLLLSVKACDGQESYGECVIALKSMFAARPQKCVTTLTHLGEETGVLNCMMHVKPRNDSQLPKPERHMQRAYDLIYVDTDLINGSRSDEHDLILSEDAAAQIYQDVMDFQPIPPKPTSSTASTNPSSGTTALPPPLASTLPSPTYTLPSKPQTTPASGTLGTGKAPAKSPSPPAASMKSSGMSSPAVPCSSVKVIPVDSLLRHKQPDGCSASCAAAAEESGDSNAQAMCPAPNGTEVRRASANNTVTTNRYSDWPVRHSLASSSSSDMPGYEEVEKNTYEEVREMMAAARPRPEPKPRTTVVSGATPGGVSGGGVIDGALAVPGAAKKKPIVSPPMPTVRPRATPSATGIPNVSISNGSIMVDDVKEPAKAVNDAAAAAYEVPSLVMKDQGAKGGKGEVNLARDAKTSPAIASAEVPRPPSCIYDTIPQPTPRQIPDSNTCAKRQATTIAEWLSYIGLTLYLSAFLNNGWDHIDFLTDMTSDDLHDLNVSMSADDEQTILRCIQEMKEQKRTNQSNV